MSNTPTVLSNSSLTNSQDPKWVAEGLAYWDHFRKAYRWTYLANGIATETDVAILG
jgi:hypothetical protein